MVVSATASLTSNILRPARSQDVLELAASNGATVNVNHHSITSETYISRTATFINQFVPLPNFICIYLLCNNSIYLFYYYNNRNSYYFDVFLNLCPGYTFSVTDLPALCSIDGTGPLPTCNTPVRTLACHNSHNIS